MRPFTAALSPLFLAAALTATPVFAQETSVNGTISIGGIGEVTAAPDYALNARSGNGGKHEGKTRWRR